MQPFLLGEIEAERLIWDNAHYALLSIRNAGKPPQPWETHGPRLDLAFDDLSSRGSDASLLAGYEPPRAEHAAKIVRFADELQEVAWAGGLIVHCSAGVSRSAAALIGVGRVVTGSDEGAIQMLTDAAAYTKRLGLREYPPHPNARLVALIDLNLGLGGSLVRATLAAFPRLVVVSQAVEAEVMADALQGD